MRVPAIKGVIDRRILANYRIDVDVMRAVLPQPFRPKVAHGYAIGGICLIRLKEIRPTRLPTWVGISSENAAHRIAVEWDTPDGVREGVYVPRRDTNSRLNSLAGGRLFPGEHHFAKFDVKESPQHFRVNMRSNDGVAGVSVAGAITATLPRTSIFPSVEDVSTFFERGSLGYSATREPGRYDGLELKCIDWQVTPLDVDHVSSSYFEDENTFPSGSVTFDCALLMRDIQHEWRGREGICCPANTTK